MLLTKKCLFATQNLLKPLNLHSEIQTVPPAMLILNSEEPFQGVKPVGEPISKRRAKQMGIDPTKPSHSPSRSGSMFKFPPDLDIPPPSPNQVSMERFVPHSVLILSSMSFCRFGRFSHQKKSLPRTLTSKKPLILQGALDRENAAHKQRRCKQDRSCLQIPVSPGFSSFQRRLLGSLGSLVLVSTAR